MTKATTLKPAKPVKAPKAPGKDYTQERVQDLPARKKNSLGKHRSKKK